MEKHVIGIYHRDCIDGTSAAAVLLKRFPNAKLFPLKHNFSPEDINPILENVSKDTQVYTVDCGLGVKELLPIGCKIVTVDHHISAKDTLEQLAKEYDHYTFVFDNEKSGASLAWDYFFPGESKPELITYVEDSDLWNWKYGDDTRHVNDYLFVYINQPEVMLGLFDRDLSGIKEKGKVISEHIDFNVHKALARIQPVTLHIAGHTLPAYNITRDVSLVGNILAEKTGQVAIMFTINGDKVKLDFRSKDGQEPSAVELATSMGGGGHRNASGAEIDLPQFLQMISE